METQKNIKENFSRTWVALCNKTNFNGFYFRKFVLPEEFENTKDNAAWYFLNKLNFTACIEFCIKYKDYLNCTPEDIF
jgi:hypothetical protein